MSNHWTAWLRLPARQSAGNHSHSTHSASAGRPSRPKTPRVDAVDPHAGGRSTDTTAGRSVAIVTRPSDLVSLPRVLTWERWLDALPVRGDRRDSMAVGPVPQTAAHERSNEGEVLDRELRSRTA